MLIVKLYHFFNVRANYKIKTASFEDCFLKIISGTHSRPIPQLLNTLSELILKNRNSAIFELKQQTVNPIDLQGLKTDYIL